MFYLNYLFAEVFRRWGKTLIITLGLSIASAIIILIISISNALSRAQETVLNPLANVGTDIMVTRSVNADNPRDLDESTRNEMMTQNRISMDLSKLGNPGEKFSNDSFLPGTMLTFVSNSVDSLDKSLIANYATGLILNVSHQEGTIPKVTTSIETGGETINVEQNIAPMTDVEREAINSAREKARAEIQTRGLDPKSEEAREIDRKYMDAAMPERFSKMRASVTTEKRLITKDVGPISTDINTYTLSVAGVDTSKSDIGLILPNQIVEGDFFSGDNQIVINKSYADKEGRKVGEKISLNKKEYTVVGIVSPRLYTDAADLYLPLTELQDISGKSDRINIILVKSANANAVEETSKKMEGLFAGATVMNSHDTAKQVSGSLISAANLTNRFIGLTSVIVVVAAFIIVSLLTVSSINKRTREIGTLKAIGWSNSEVLRQIVVENIALGVIGAIVGVGFGVLAILILNKYNISLSA
ncbi:MAG: FtsX-like permease family protein, partial [Patescibacteria group bacterium]